MNNTPKLRELLLHQCYSFVMFSGVSFCMVYLPLILREAGYGLKDIGFLLGTYSIVGLACILLYGRLLDALRCYRLLVLGGLGLVMFALGRLLFWNQLHWSLGAIVLLGAGFLPQPSLLDNYISTRYQHQVQYYGRIRSLGSMGYIAFLGLAAVLHLFDPFDPWRLQLWIFGLYGLVGLLFWFSSIDSLPIIRAEAAATQVAETEKQTELQASSGQKSQKTGVQQLGWPLIIVLLLFVVFWALIMGVNGNFLALYLKDQLGQRDISLFFIVATASEVPVIFWGGRILYGKPLGWMLLLGFGAALLRMLIYAALPYAIAVLLGQLLHSVAYGLFHISIIAIINRYFTRYRGTAIGIYSSIPSLSNAMGAVLGGIIIQELGFTSFFWIFLLLPLPVFIPIYLLRHRFLYL